MVDNWGGFKELIGYAVERWQYEKKSIINQLF